MEKQHRARIMSASNISQQEHSISNWIPVGNACFSNDLPDVFNLCKFQNTRSKDKLHDTLLLQLSDDTNLANIVRSCISDVVDN